MRFLRNIYSWIQNKFRRLVSRNRAVVLFRSPNSFNQRNRGGNTNPSGNNHRHTNPWDRPPSEFSAAQQAFMSHQGEQSYIDFRKIPADGSIERESEDWQFSEDGIRLVERKTLAKMAAGIIAPPSEARGICSYCGEYIAGNSLFRCFADGGLLCEHHARIVPVRNCSGVAIYCPIHAELYKKHFNGWQNAIDGNPATPPSDQSIAALIQSQRSAIQ